MVDIDFSDYIHDTGEYTSNQTVEELPEPPMSRFGSPAATLHIGSESDVDNDFTLRLQNNADSRQTEDAPSEITQSRPAPALATDQEE